MDRSTSQLDVKMLYEVHCQFLIMIRKQHKMSINELNQETQQANIINSRWKLAISWKE